MAKRGETKPKLRVLMGAAVALGPGKARLLDAIMDSGSISEAARRMGMSYRRAWTLVEAMNRDFLHPLVQTSAGGAGGGGARVTGWGAQALARYREMEEKAAAAVAEDLADFEGFLAREPDDGED